VAEKGGKYEGDLSPVVEESEADQQSITNIQNELAELHEKQGAGTLNPQDAGQMAYLEQQLRSARYEEQTREYALEKARQQQEMKPLKRKLDQLQTMMILGFKHWWRPAVPPAPARTITKPQTNESPQENKAA
jgi:hypothetical protein